MAEEKTCAHHHVEEIDTDEDNTGIPPYDQCVDCGEEFH